MKTEKDLQQKTCADFVKALQRQYPQGVAVKLPDESLAHLMDIHEALLRGEEYLLDAVSWQGKIESTDRSRVGEGILNAEFRLPAEKYDRILPDEEAYPLDTPEADAMDWEDRAATRLLQVHGDDLKGAHVEIVIREDVLPHLHIEGRPFPEVMEAVQRVGCLKDEEVRQLVALQQMHRDGFSTDYSIPPCLEPLFKDVTDKYRGGDGQVADKAACMREVFAKTEIMLKNCRALSCDPHNLVATFRHQDGYLAAREAANYINRFYAPETAFAKQDGDTVEVSIHDRRARYQVMVKQDLLLDAKCQVVAQAPFRDMNYKNTVCLWCENGQMLKGHLGLEGLDHRYAYALKQVNGKPVLETNPEPECPEALFTTDDKVIRFNRTFHGEQMPVSRIAGFDELKKMQLLDNVRFYVPDERTGGKDQVWLGGRIGGELVEPHKLDETDARLYSRFREIYKDKKDYDMAKFFLCSDCYKNELDNAWAKEQQYREQLLGKVKERQDVLDRITDAVVYGKVDNIQVRCKVDGEQQMGRPITQEDAAKYAAWKDIANLLGKDSLNYKNYLHSDYIKEIAAHAYEDVLARKSGQELVQGMHR